MAKYGEGLGVSMPSPRNATPQISRCSPTQTLLEPCPLGIYGGFLTHAQLNKSLATGDRFNHWAFSSPWRWD